MAGDNLAHKAFLVAVVTFMVFLASVGIRGQLTAPTTEFNEQVRMATYLAEGRGFICPVGPPRDDPSSWYVPGYIGVSAALIKAFGPGPAGLAAIRIVGLVALAGAVALWFAIGRVLLGRRITSAGMVLIWLSPSLHWKAPEIWDTHWAMLAGAGVLGYFVLARPRRWTGAFLGGLLAGAAVMINPCFTLCYPFWVVWAWLRAGRRNTDDGGGSLRVRPRLPLVPYAATVLAGFLLVITPWTIRNYRTFGELFYLRGNLPLELWAGNAPWADGYFFTEEGQIVHPVFNETEAQRMVELGEWGYFQACRADLLRWWQAGELRLGTLSIKRVYWFWIGRYDRLGSRTLQLFKAIGHAVPGVLAWIGAGVALWRGRRAGVLVWTLAVFPVIYYLTLALNRYRMPLEPLVLLLSAAAIVAGWDTLRRRAATK